jgi:hypothetical protein
MTICIKYLPVDPERIDYPTFPPSSPNLLKISPLLNAGRKFMHWKIKENNIQVPKPA